MLALSLILQLVMVNATQNSSYDELLTAGRNALNQAQYADAERFLGTAVEEAETANLGRTRLAIALNDLAEANRRMGRYAEAESRFKRSIGLLRTEPRSRLFVMVLNNLGALYRNSEQYLRSAECFKESLAVAKKTLPAGDPLFGTIWVGLASVSARKGDFRAAEKYLVQSLRIRENAFGPVHSDVAESLNNLGAAQHRRKHYAKAAATLLRGLEVMEKSLGPNHNDVAILLNNLGVVYRDLKKGAEAEAVLRRSLEIYRGNSRSDQSMANTLFNLADTLLDKQGYSEAEPLLKEAVAILSARPHVADMDDALIYEKYAAVLRLNGHSVDADAAEARAKSMRLELKYTFRP